MNFEESLKYLQDQYLNMNWTYYDLSNSNSIDKICPWPGNPAENVLICVHKSDGHQELFHRHDFFYFNYTYRGNYDSVSFKYDNVITIHTDELYAGQPFAGHALCVHDNQNTIIIGILIQKEAFFKNFLPMLSSNIKLLNFFLNPYTNHSSDEFILFQLEKDSIISSLLEMIVVEYANKKADTQDMLNSLVLSFLIEVSRQYAASTVKKTASNLSEQIVQYISQHYSTVSLKNIAEHFSYNPNYISTLLVKETGKTFSQLLLEQRMERAKIFLQGTTLSITEIADMLGYSNSSNFHKAFREYYHISPREYVKQLDAAHF